MQESGVLNMQKNDFITWYAYNLHLKMCDDVLTENYQNFHSQAYPSQWTELFI